MSWYKKNGARSAAKPEPRMEPPEVQALRLASNKLVSLLLHHLMGPASRGMVPLCERWLNSLSSHDMLKVAEGLDEFVVEIHTLRDEAMDHGDPVRAVDDLMARIAERARQLAPSA